MQKIFTEWFSFCFLENLLFGGGFSKYDTLHDIIGKKITLETFEPITLTVKTNKFPELPFLQGTTFKFPSICNHY
jgi:hypothetical protein